MGGAVDERVHGWHGVRREVETAGTLVDELLTHRHKHNGFPVVTLEAPHRYVGMVTRNQVRSSHRPTSCNARLPAMGIPVVEWCWWRLPLHPATPCTPLAR